MIWSGFIVACSVSSRWIVIPVIEPEPCVEGEIVIPLIAAMSTALPDEWCDGFFAYQMITGSRNKSMEVVSQKETKSDTLPDGSGVFLNKKTELAYTFDKKEKSHVVKLKGEAYFNIQHENDKNFIIDAAGVFIRDIGTSFNVKAYPEDNTVEVVVEEGKVMFYTGQGFRNLFVGQGKRNL